MNTSSANVEQIKNIMHPSNFSNKLHEEVLGCIYGKTGHQLEVSLMEEETTSSRSPEPNKIFLVSDVQPDKSPQDNANKVSGPQSRIDIKHGRPTNSTIPGEVNILLISNIQSGKTSLIMTMKLYPQLDQLPMRSTLFKWAMVLQTKLSE